MTSNISRSLSALTVMAALSGSGVSAQETPTEPEGPDANVEWIKENGFAGFAFGLGCVSVGSDGSVIDVAPLPVGPERWLECTTDGPLYRSTTEFLDEQDQRWCALGELSQSSTGGDPRLTIDIADAPETGPWLLHATSSDEITVSPSSFSGAQAWPLWVDVRYATSAVEPNPNFLACDALFGL